MTKQQEAAIDRQCGHENLIATLVDALETMVRQFTKTPSTLKDTEARVKAYAALKLAKEQA
jgi:hypothetical protein